MDTLKKSIEELWDVRDGLSSSDSDARDTVFRVLDLLDRGRERVAYVDERGEVVVNEWCKLAILLAFKLFPLQEYEVGPFEFFDRLPLKRGFRELGVRVLPGGSARFGSYLAPGVTLMPSYVNIGAYVDENSMVDTWATVGSCAQIGKRVHLSGGVGIGGVLEPPQAAPVVIEDDAFIGSRAMITEGARVGKGSVVGQGVILSSSIPVIDTETGIELGRGRIPDHCVAVMGIRSRTFKGGEFGLPAVLIIRRLAPGERHDKVQLNSLLREHGISV